MNRYPSLRVAYIDEVEEPSKDRSKKVNDKVYYSTLVKAALPKSNSSEPGQNLDQVKGNEMEVNYFSRLKSFSEFKNINSPVLMR